VIYIPALWTLPKVKSLEAGRWRGFFFDPRTGHETAITSVEPDGSGTWQPPLPPILADWVLVVERAKSYRRVHVWMLLPQVKVART
jgi:hypothetical protein